MSDLEYPPLDDLRPMLAPDRTLRGAADLRFPFAVLDGGPALSTRAAHVREQIELVLFTTPGERPHRPEFGAGVDALVFEPGGQALTTMVRQRLVSTLAESLAGEVDPESIRVDVEMLGEQTLRLTIGYRLATIGEDHEDAWMLVAGAVRPAAAGGTP